MDHLPHLSEQLLNQQVTCSEEYFDKIHLIDKCFDFYKTTIQKFGVGKIFFMFLKKVKYALLTKSLFIWSQI